MKKKIAALASCLLIIAAAQAASCAEQPKPQIGINKGQVAPDFSISDLAGKQVSLSSFKGEVVCLLFWATWCPYCIREVPRFKELHNKYAAKGFKILSIDIAANDPKPRVEAFQQKNQLPYQILYDEGQKATMLYYVYGVPVTVIIDRKGVIQYRGYQLPENVDQLITQLL